MRGRTTTFILRWVSLLFIFAAAVLTLVQLVTYSRLRTYYPDGMTIAGVPVSGLDPQGASQRLLEVYTRPVELRYAGAIIDLSPTVAGYEIDVEAMLAAADLQRTGSGFWTGFWDYLWNRQSTAQDVPLRKNFSEPRLRTYLKNEVAARYDQPATSAQPIPGQAEFQPGQAGQELDIDRAVTLVEDALSSPTNRVVSLSFQRTASARPPLQNLQLLLQSIVDSNGYDGLVGVYMRDLQSGEELHFAYQTGQNYSVEPTDIAFTASSTVKIPILVSVYRQFGPKIDADTAALVLAMIKKSENPPSDALMEKLDARGPLYVSDTMEAIGLQNTFLAGYFYQGADLLKVFQTPSNQRIDVNTNPDSYSQTTPSEIGMLLEDIYQCAQNDGGTLIAAFPGKVDQASCQEMIEYLKSDQIGVLLEAGVPEGTQVAHKHGWVSDPFGVIQNVSDAGIIYTPGGNYILTVYLYHPVQVLFETANAMIAQMSKAVYNYYNLPTQ